MSAQIDLLDEIIVDNFAGGGGASTGIELATGRIVEIAINHDPDAILMHKTNHPFTHHIQASVWDVDPKEVCKGRNVGLAWFSPDCKHFSKAKGSALVDRNIRGLAWIVLRWAGTVRPRVIILENVEEFQTWGPVRKGKPVKKLAGTTFKKFLGQLEGLGYEVDHRELIAADYGAPTSRKRFVLVARCDGRPIVWPKPTHAPAGSEAVRSGRLKTWRSAAEIIDWSLPCPSVFESKAEIMERYGLAAVRPLADNTMRRIIRGVDKFTIRGNPYIVPGGAASLIQYHSEQNEGAQVSGLRNPLTTVDASNRYGLTVANLVEYYGGGRPLDVDEPMHTVTSHDREAVVTAHIVKFKGTNLGHRMDEPMQTVTASAGEFAACKTRLEKLDGGDLKRWPEIRELLNRYCGYSLADDEVLLLDIGGAEYYIADIGLRMLTPRELYNAMGFPPDYRIDRDYTGKEYPKAKQVARCGNAVCPPMAEAVVRANLPEWCGAKIETMSELERRIAI